MKFFEDILGPEGASALHNLCKHEPAFKPLVYTKTVIEWLKSDDVKSFQGVFDDGSFSFQKVDGLFKGEILSKTMNFNFENFGESELVGALMLATGHSFDGTLEKPNWTWARQYQNPVITLEKSIQKLIKARKNFKVRQEKKSKSQEPSPKESSAQKLDKDELGLAKPPSAETGHHQPPKGHIKSTFTIPKIAPK